MLLLTAGLFVSSSYAQKISGTVTDEQGKALEKTTVTLLKAKDSSVAKYSATDKSGVYNFNASGPGSFIVKVTHVGYQPSFSKAFDASEGSTITVPQINLMKIAETLGGVSVSSKKPMVEVKADKMILNVEGTINAIGTDALELLRKSPGVLVDKDDNVTLAGKNGVQVWIDGKPSPLTGTDLAAYLKTLQSAQIESIEIITNPSAKYDAAGNAGIINIRLKKNKAFGTNGSVNGGYNIGVYPKYNAGLALNHREGKVNIFGNYNYNNSKNEMKLNTYREVLDSIFDQKNVLVPKNQSHGFKAGVDYFANGKSTFGVVVNGNLSDNDMHSNSRTLISYKPTGLLDRILFANNTTDAKRNNVNFNGNYRYADTSGHEFNLDADYGMFRIRTNQFQPNQYYTATMPNTFLGQTVYRFISPTNIDIYTIKGDYEQNFKKGRLGFGFKSSLTNTANTFERYNVTQIKPEIRQIDTSRSNQFNYHENINAVYVNYNKQFKKGLMIQFGLRMENTSSTGDSYGLDEDAKVKTNTKETFKKNYTDFFPSAAVTLNKNPMSQWALSYSRRIDRPAYQDLNPFEFKLDDYTYMKGNTNLRPQYSHVISLSNTYKYKLTTKLTYSHVDDVFAQLVDVDSIQKSKAYLTKRNLATQDVANLNVSYMYMHKAYTAFMNFSSTYSHYRADFTGTGAANGSRVIDVDAFSVSFFMQNSLKIGKKGWTAELSGFYNSPSIWGGTFKSNTIWSVDGGFQKPVFKGKGNFKISVSDMFGSLKWTGTSDYNGQKFIVSGRPEATQLRTSLTWRFGSNTVKGARQRKDAQEEENKRTQGGGGIGVGGN